MATKKGILVLVFLKVFFKILLIGLPSLVEMNLSNVTIEYALMSNKSTTSFNNAQKYFSVLSAKDKNNENESDFYIESRNKSVQYTKPSTTLNNSFIIEEETDKINKTVKLVFSNVEDDDTFKMKKSNEKVFDSSLDDFVTGSFDAEASNIFPIFLVEPQSSFVVKNRPAILKCKAAHALQVHFKCSGSSQPPPSVHEKHVDPHTGVHLEEVTATIGRDLVDEFFGKGPFKCDCLAWSSRGVLKSQTATITIAYIRKQFLTSPTSLKVEIGSRVEFYCEPPPGLPTPKITWYKNNVPISNASDKGFLISLSGTLAIQQGSLQDNANYSCGAENIAGKRISDAATLIVYVNGGWSAWSHWRDCKCGANIGKGKKRSRSCNNPKPINGGEQCTGRQVEKSVDCITCSDDFKFMENENPDLYFNKRGKWSSWTEWSLCSAECLQYRTRKCIISNGDRATSEEFYLGLNNNELSAVKANKLYCLGKDIQTAECRGNQCKTYDLDSDWSFYIGFAFILLVCFVFGIIIICYSRRNINFHHNYNMTQTDKKSVRIHNDSVNECYDYISTDQRFIINGNPGYRMTEHHYDVPNLTNYANPIDELDISNLSESVDSTNIVVVKSNVDLKKMETISSVAKNETNEELGRNGGDLKLYNGEIILYVPDLALGKTEKKLISLTLLGDESFRVSNPITDSFLLCSAIVHCTPQNFNFLKPVILKIPHCLLNYDLWSVNVFHADNELDDINITWRKIIIVGEETINTPVFVQVEQRHIYIMTEQLGRFAVTARPKSDLCTNPSIKMKLLAFSQLAPNSTNSSLRIYVVRDLPNNKDLCTNIELQLGGTFMGQSDTFAFFLNKCSLNIRVCSQDKEKINSAIHVHTIPYNHILNNCSILHCEFNFKQDELLQMSSEYCVDFGQSDDTYSHENIQSFILSKNEHINDAHTSWLTTISLDHQGNFVNDAVATSITPLPRTAKRLICTALDPPRSDENDWRMLAKKLNTDHYIAYFATKPSPTEQILNLWECKENNALKSITKLLLIFKEMGRQDVIDIITESIGPLWI
ncbi:netrin receptor unc-5 isoform X2 [Teleopsis dalmanni]|uniref:netrin receptor unc-5 isoform X2 n=1 Tax=Teleopsis dalmanni TaxID=139649 RepID=UPI0018CFE735|nr:netrin receptor unc-5 isoform X2 [Teleopsis dalmanni]